MRNEEADSLVDSGQFDSADIQNNQNNNLRDIEHRIKQSEDQIKHRMPPLMDGTKQ